MLYETEPPVGSLVTWKADIGSVSREIGVVISLEPRGDDESKLMGAWIKWSSSSAGWSPLDCLVVIGHDGLRVS